MPRHDDMIVGDSVLAPFPADSLDLAPSRRIPLVHPWHCFNVRAQYVTRTNTQLNQQPNQNGVYWPLTKFLHGKETTISSRLATGATFHVSTSKSSQTLICGYRPASGSLWSSVASLARMHNQTVNVYSHLIGAMIFIIYPIQLYGDSQLGSSLVQWEDFLILTIYCYSVATCLLFSSMFVYSQWGCPDARPHTLIEL